MGGTALGASGRSNNGLKLDVKTGKLSLWRLFPTFTFTFTFSVPSLQSWKQTINANNAWMVLCTAGKEQLQANLVVALEIAALT